jgi:hypothetical protein
LTTITHGTLKIIDIAKTFSKESWKESMRENPDKRLNYSFFMPNSI